GELAGLVGEVLAYAFVSGANGGCTGRAGVPGGPGLWAEPGHARRCARPRVTVAVRLPDAPTAPVASRYSVPRPHRARPAAPASPTLTRSDVVTLPDPLLDAVRERVRNGLSDTTADRSLAEEIAGRVVAYLRNTAETTVSVD